MEINKGVLIICGPPRASNFIAAVVRHESVVARVVLREKIVLDQRKPSVVDGDGYRSFVPQ